MRSRLAVAVFVAVCSLGFAQLLYIGSNDRSKLVGTIGVVPQEAVVTLSHGERACQFPVVLPRNADEVVVGPTANGHSVDLELELESLARSQTTRVVGEPESRPWLGSLPLSWLAAEIETASADQIVSVCVTNEGRRRVQMYGEKLKLGLTGIRQGDKTEFAGDIAIQFRGPPRSFLAQIGDVAGRFSLFKAGFVEPWMLWALVVALLIATGLCGWALWRSFR